MPHRRRLRHLRLPRPPRHRPPRRLRPRARLHPQPPNPRRSPLPMHRLRKTDWRVPDSRSSPRRAPPPRTRARARGTRAMFVLLLVRRQPTLRRRNRPPRLGRAPDRRRRSLHPGTRMRAYTTSRRAGEITPSGARRRARVPLRGMGARREAVRSDPSAALRHRSPRRRRNRATRRPGCVACPWRHVCCLLSRSSRAPRRPPGP